MPQRSPWSEALRVQQAARQSIETDSNLTVPNRLKDYFEAMKSPKIRFSFRRQLEYILTEVTLSLDADVPASITSRAGGEPTKRRKSCTTHAATCCSLMARWITSCSIRTTLTVYSVRPLIFHKWLTPLVPSCKHVFIWIFALKAPATNTGTMTRVANAKPIASRTNRLGTKGDNWEWYCDILWMENHGNGYWMDIEWTVVRISSTTTHSIQDQCQRNPMRFSCLSCGS